MRDFAPFYFVTSPGTRNMPIISAMEQEGSVIPVLDERSAAFYAIGLYEATGVNVALTCTSGSAVLDYAPAIAEAYYRHIPLIVISADRPADRLDQNEGQTINQVDILRNVVCYSISLNEQLDDEQSHSDAVDAISRAFKQWRRWQRPIHINIHLAEPLKPFTEPTDLDIFPADAYSSILSRPRELTKKHIAQIFEAPRTMLCLGQLPRIRRAESVIDMLNDRDVVTVGQNVCNIPSFEVIPGIDGLFVYADDELERYTPDRIVYVGGAPMSRRLREFITRHRIPTIIVSREKRRVDTFGTLIEHINMLPEEFFTSIYINGIAPRHTDSSSAFSRYWHQASCLALSLTNDFVDESPWCDFYAIHKVLNRFRECHVQLSNSTVIRYADLYDCRRCLSVSANRGVNGIDGSVSTAIGFADAVDQPMLLICGDLSARYDIGALLNIPLPETFKMVIIDNNGGDIFRCIPTTKGVDFREQCLSLPARIKWSEIAAAASMTYFYADSKSSLDETLTAFYEAPSASLLVVDTHTVDNASIFNKYYNSNQQ